MKFSRTHVFILMDRCPVALSSIARVRGLVIDQAKKSCP